MLGVKIIRRKRVYPGEPEGFLSKVNWHFWRKSKKMLSKCIPWALDRVPHQPELERIKRMILDRLCGYVGDLSLLPLVSHAALAQQTLTLLPASVSTISPPRAPAAALQLIESPMPALQAHVIIGAEVASNSTAIVAGGAIGVPEFYTNHRTAVITDPHLLFWHGYDGLGLAKRSEVTSQASGTMLFAHGAANWYHWLIENLPAAFLSQDLPDGLADLPLVIPADIAHIASFRDSLELFRNGRDVVALAPGAHHFERLVVIDSPVREPMNLRVGTWPDVQDYSFNRNLLCKYRCAIFDRLGLTMPQHDKRIFLARATERRNFNQAELLGIAERYGFVAVYPELLTFKEQVTLLASAAFVIGPSGAAFANTLFCQPGTRLLSWLPPPYKNFCSYMNIANITESRLRYLFTTPDRPLRSSFDVFVAGYNVDCDAFEAALRCALDSPDY